ncbi:MAG: prepilin peptidase [Candidatus Zambryskibacteria bacterium]|nr:prepilin peptidase [Candidatus Zambryskibacteria bacterium]
MMILFFLAVAILGLLVGSFLNVVIYRYNTGLSFAKGRSQCFVCGKKLVWYELIPVVSFVIQKGRCRSCQTKISLQYPVVEALTSLLFVAVAWRQVCLYPVFSVFENGLSYSCILAVYYAVVVSLLLAIAVYDMRHKIIPDGLVYTFIALATAKLLLFTYFFGLPLNMGHTLNLLAPLLLFTPFALLWLVSKGMWIGFGDAKLAFGIGALLGLPLGLSAIMLGFWIGAAVSILLLVLQKFMWGQTKMNLKSEIPFAPFLIIGTLVVLFTHLDILGLTDLLNG